MRALTHGNEDELRRLIVTIENAGHFRVGRVELLRHAEWLLERYWPNEFGRTEAREIIYVHEPAPLPVQSQPPEVRMETRWTKEEIPFSKAQLEYLSDLRSIANNGGDADGR